MSFVTLQMTLGSAVAQSGTFTATYPDGHEGGDFAGGYDHRMIVNQREYTAPNDFTVSFGGTTATITWKGTNTLASGSEVRLQFDQAGTVAPTGVLRAHLADVLRIDLGSPVTSNDAALRANAAYTGGAVALTLITAGKTFDVPRNVIITSSGDDSAKTFVVTGEDEYGETVVETITGANAGVAAGKKAFKTITSILPSGNAAANLKIGFGDVLGLPVHLPYATAIIKELEDDASASSGTTVAGLSKLTAATATNADVRGTYDPNSACNGAKAFSLVVVLANPTFLGVPQYAG